MHIGSSCFSPAVLASLLMYVEDQEVHPNGPMVATIHANENIYTFGCAGLNLFAFTECL